MEKLTRIELGKCRQAIMSDIRDTKQRRSRNKFPKNKNIIVHENGWIEEREALREKILRIILSMKDENL